MTKKSNLEMVVFAFGLALGLPLVIVISKFMAG